MEANIFDAIPGFDRLLEQKTFEALTCRERGQVLQYISEEEYNRFRQSVLVAQHGTLRRKSPLAPDPSVKSRLMQRSGTAEGFLSRILGYRIPAYQAGLAASVLLFLVFYLLVQNDPVPAVIAVADTVYVDRPVLLKDTVWLEKSRGKRPESAKAGHPPHNTGDIHFTQSMPENKLYASQMQEALGRMEVISGLDKDKSVNHDARLMNLVETSIATTPSP